MKVLNVEMEVRDLAARRDIAAACQRYMHAQDRLRPDVHLSAFHPDAHVDCGLYAGQAAGFVEFAQGFLTACGASQHLMGQHAIEVDGDRAHGELYFLAWHRVVEAGEEKDLIVAGRYIDRYERREDGWRIAERLEIVDWARTDSAADGFLKGQAGKLLRGTRGADDPSRRPAGPPAGTPGTVGG